MIAYLEGTIISIEANYAVVKQSGIGYQIYLSKRELDGLTIPCDRSFFIHTHVREDTFDLFGFSSRGEKEIFLLLTGVSGVGPRLALNIISVMSINELVFALINNDVSKLVSIPGIGKKMAERLVLELKDKALKVPVDQKSEEVPKKTSLEQAIKALGYSKSAIDKALFSIPKDDFHTLPLETLIKKTLNVLAGK